MPFTSLQLCAMGDWAAVGWYIILGGLGLFPLLSQCPKRSWPILRASGLTLLLLWHQITHSQYIVLISPSLAGVTAHLFLKNPTLTIQDWSQRSCGNWQYDMTSKFYWNGVQVLCKLQTRIGSTVDCNSIFHPSQDPHLLLVKNKYIECISFLKMHIPI